VERVGAKVESEIGTARAGEGGMLYELTGSSSWGDEKRARGQAMGWGCDSSGYAPRPKA